MRARAPGKLVLSGAYAVLEGAPAIVAAVDRWVEADSARRAQRVTDEVAAALGDAAVARAPWFDASALRSGGAHDRKLGLGSSAAIVVASLAALELDASPDLDDGALAARVLPRALAAHRQAQRGGSGIDVVASALGGVLRCVRDGEGVAATPYPWPTELVTEVWSSGEAASTSALRAEVDALREARPATYRACLAALARGAESAASSTSAQGVLDALAAQAEGLAWLGAEAGAPIVTEGCARVSALARAEAAVVLPSGAGGGDVVLHCALGPSSAAVRGAFERAGFARVPLALGARGVHAVPTTQGS